MSTRRHRQPRWWPTVGKEPDPRWTLANERTFLAYQRTALGLLVAGLAASGSQALADAPLWLAALGIPLIVLAGAVGVEGHRRFVTTQAAMRTGEPLDPPRRGWVPPVGHRRRCHHRNRGGRCPTGGVGMNRRGGLQGTRLPPRPRAPRRSCCGGEAGEDALELGILDRASRRRTTLPTCTERSSA